MNALFSNSCFTQLLVVLYVYFYFYFNFHFYSSYQCSLLYCSPYFHSSPCGPFDQLTAFYDWHDDQQDVSNDDDINAQNDDDINAQHDDGTK